MTTSTPTTEEQKEEEEKKTPEELTEAGTSGDHHGTDTSHGTSHTGEVSYGGSSTPTPNDTAS